MSFELKIYHGSNKIIEEPIFGEGKKNNDFGMGFYCTENNDLAKEWAVSSLSDGYSNCYTVDTQFMKVLYLNSDKYTILNWIAVLVEHRLFSINNPIAKKARQYLIDNFSINVNEFDVVIGYRADDSYFDYAELFLNNSISVDQLTAAMKLGKLGEQVVIKSKYAFSQLKFCGYEVAEKNKYFVKRRARNDAANEMFTKILDEDTKGLFIRDIMNGGIKNDDPRIPRNISK